MFCKERIAWFHLFFEQQVGMKIRVIRSELALDAIVYADLRVQPDSDRR
jgi:hypothetical protein